MVVDVPFVDNTLESGACSRKKLMKDGFGGCFISEGGGVDRLECVKLLLEPDDVGFHIMVMVLLEGAVADDVT